MLHRLLVVWLALPVASALGAVDGPGVQQLLVAGRTDGPPAVDGALDEPAWQRAPLFDAFVQVYPREGAPPSERTELRVLYDDRNVYVGVICHDSRPDLIVRSLGRRDQLPASDAVKVIIDPQHSHRDGYSFGVNAGGILSDALVYSDNQTILDWDAVWDAAVQLRPDGWSAELSIPLRALRFPASAIQTWGFGVQRTIARSHEEISSVLIPKGSNALISRLGHLTGMAQLQPSLGVEVIPYVAARGVLRPQFSDPATPEPRLLDPSLDVGADLKAALTRSLVLNATINPDFGQVEADQILLNLTHFERVFPEKRPFFTQGVELFQPVGADDALVQQQLFYSRRIGLTAPILAAAKVTGAVSPGVEVGVLDAVVAGSVAPPSDEAEPDRRLAYQIIRPLHLGLYDELPTTPPPPQNHFAAVVRARTASSSTVGGRVSATTPLTASCTEADMELPRALRPVGCAALGGNAAAVDWNLRTPDARWGLLGQAAASQTVGGPPSRVLSDGTVQRRGDLGAGGYVKAGKLGGEPFRFDVGYRYASPTLDLNPTGYLRTQNEHYAAASVGFVRSSGFGALHGFTAMLRGSGSWTADAKVGRGGQVNLDVTAVLPGFHTMELILGLTDLGYDIREIGVTGIPFQRPTQRFAELFFTTDPTRLLSLDGAASLIQVATPAPEARALGWGWWADGTLTFRPHERLETKLNVSTEYTPSGPRYVDTLEPDRFVFGDLNSQFLSVTFRQQLVVTPRLTLQAYAQLFTNFGVFGPFFEGHAAQGEALRLQTLEPASYASDPGFHSAQLNLNVVLRWEYRLGSTLFLVYSRAQGEPPLPPGERVPATVLPLDLFRGPSTDVLLVKWSYWWT